MATQTPFISQLGLELIEEGRVEGREEGRCVGLREALHRFLAARRIELTPAQRNIVDTCTDAALLDAWIERAGTATDAGGVFRPA